MEALDGPLFDFGWRRRPGDSRGGVGLLGCAGSAHTGASFQVRDFSASKATIMDEPFTDAATRPSATEHGEVPIQTFLTHPTHFGFDAQ